MKQEDIYQVIKEQLAREFNCSLEDLSRKENVITSPVLHPQRRKFSESPFFLQIMTLGDNAIISADERMHPWLNEWVKGKQGFWLFEQHNYYELEQELRKFGYKMSLTHHMFAPKPEMEKVNTSLNIKWFEQEDLHQFYGKQEFANALCDCFHENRPDMLAVAAMNGDSIMGMAGCSADTPKLWQIGIDVLPQYRGMGIGTILVKLLKNETFRRGAIPYYGTSLSNIGSWKIALASGFLPMWIEAESLVCEDNTFMKYL